MSSKSKKQSTKQHKQNVSKRKHIKSQSYQINKNKKKKSLFTNHRKKHKSSKKGTKSKSMKRTKHQKELKQTIKLYKQNHKNKHNKTKSKSMKKKQKSQNLIVPKNTNKNKKKKKISQKNSKKISSKNKVNTQKKRKSIKQKQQSDRIMIQMQKDVEMAKKRLHKKQLSDKQKTTNKIRKNPKNNNNKMLSDNELWTAYINKFGNSPQNVSHFQNFSKTNPNCNTLNYKQSQIIFNKFSGKNVNNNNMTKNYVERDIITAKKRFSHTLSLKKASEIIVSLTEKKENDTLYVHTLNTLQETKDTLDVLETSKRNSVRSVSSYYISDENIDEKIHNNSKVNDKYSSNKSTIFEILAFMESERKYVYNGLRIVIETFLNRLRVHNKIKKQIISENDIHSIFGNYETIYNVNSKLYNDLKELHKTLQLNNGIKLNELVIKFGKKLNEFIPYFKIYCEYIVKKQSAILHLEHLKKSNKTFKEFLKINELCVKTKLRLLLEEPAHRIPQYLQYLVNIYTSYKHESINNKKCEKLLLQSISDIKKVSDSIAVKCRDMRARLLVGTLQRELFGNKIKLLSPHRFCIAYSSMHILLHNKIKQYKFILLNDIFLISTFSSKFKSAQLMLVYPLIGLRINKLTNIEKFQNDKHQYHLLNSNRGYKLQLLPSDIIIIFDTFEKMNKWIEIIESAVDKQEHSLKQCNVVDLEKRLRKQKTSKDGMSETINISNPERIKVIEKWRQENGLFASIPTIPVKHKQQEHNYRRRSKTLGGIKSAQKSIKTLLSRKRSNTNNVNDNDDEKKTNSNISGDGHGKVRVMRDEEVLQFDEEIPMENFMKALNSGFVKITNEDEQNEQYRKAIETAKNLVDNSLQSYRASVFSNDDWSSSDSDDDWD